MVLMDVDITETKILPTSFPTVYSSQVAITTADRTESTQLVTSRTAEGLGNNERPFPGRICFLYFIILFTHRLLALQ